MTGAGVVCVAVVLVMGLGSIPARGAGDTAPTANPGGPYTAAPGQTIQLDGSGSSDPDPGDAITYAWDLNNDGIFGDSTAVKPNFTAGTVTGTAYSVCLRVEDTAGLQDTKCTIVIVGDITPPSITAGGPITIVELPNGNTGTATGTATAFDNFDGAVPTTCTTVTLVGVPGAVPAATGQSTCTATDSSGNSSSATEQVILVDETPPVITATASKTVFTSQNNGSASASLTVSATAADNNDGTIPASCTPGVLTLTAPGSTLATCTATDAAGNTASATVTLTLIDDTPPVISCNPAAFALNQSPANVTGVATDNVSPVSQTVSAPADTSTAGTRSVTLTATDDAGNSATKSCLYSVAGYTFSGFLAPVNNPTTVNTGKAGRTYPVKFQLKDSTGNFVSSLSAVTAIGWNPTTCGSWGGDPTDPLETTTTGGTSLRYDSAANQYVYNWATPKAGCYTFFVKLNDGTTHSAFFNLS
jgi:PKD domain-containing protein